MCELFSQISKKVNGIVLETFVRFMRQTRPEDATQVVLILAIAGIVGIAGRKSFYRSDESCIWDLPIFRDRYGFVSLWGVQL